MEEYEYLENLNSEELAKIIDQMLDFEETTKALMILEEKDSQKALELGKDIIKNKKESYRAYKKLFYDFLFYFYFTYI